ncbi:MAG: hypothetical protein ACLT0Y_08605 [Christensenellales bacterium]
MKPWAERFYNSDAWRACREGFLQSKGYLCERCSTPDNPIVAKIAHKFIDEAEYKRSVHIAFVG